jgi:hypothetical protein
MTTKIYIFAITHPELKFVAFNSFDKFTTYYKELYKKDFIGNNDDKSFFLVNHLLFEDKYNGNALLFDNNVRNISFQCDFLYGYPSYSSISSNDKDLWLNSVKEEIEYEINEYGVKVDDTESYGFILKNNTINNTNISIYTNDNPNLSKYFLVENLEVK